MSTLVKWNPYREMAQMHRLMNQRLRNPLAFQTPEAPGPWRYVYSAGIALDVAEVDESYVVKASVPGINPDDIEVTLDDNVLTIRGEAQSDSNIEKANYHIRERRSGSFSRSIKLPVAINTDAIEAVNEHGVLTVSLPKAEVAKPQRIAVQVGGGDVAVAEDVPALEGEAVAA